MGRNGVRHRADPPPRRTTTPRGAQLATLAILITFVLAISGLAVAAVRDGGTTGPTGIAGTAAGDRSSARAPIGSAPGGSAIAAPSGTSTTRHEAERAERAADRSRRSVRMHVLPGRHLTHVRPFVVIKPTTFRVASFNLLGASHTAGRGGRAGYASGPQRLAGELRLLLDKQITVAGLQEFQPPQVDAFRHLTGGAWQIYPGSSVDNSIVWLASEWTLVKTETVGFPYFHHREVPDPVVLLRNVDSGRTVWFVNLHSPADVHGMHNAALRAATVGRAASLVDQLASDGTPVVLTGDMNDRAPFACSFTRLSGMHSSDGWRTDNGTCRPGVGYPNVDWIMGSDAVAFTDGAPDFVSEHRHLSDHPIITATATIAGSRTRR